MGKDTEFPTRLYYFRMGAPMKGLEVIFSKKSTEHFTPLPLYRKYNERFKFTLDPCTTDDNPLGTPKFYTINDNGLEQTWDNERVFCNPPYGRDIIKWVKKAYYSEAEVVAMLLPVRTDTKWFHDYIYQQSTIEFIRGRLRFSQSKNSAPFPSMVCIF